jgi:cytochrome b561
VFLGDVPDKVYSLNVSLLRISLGEIDQTRALGYLFFATIVTHFSAVLFHTLIMRDHLIDRMVPWKVRGPEIGKW